MCVCVCVCVHVCVCVCVRACACVCVCVWGGGVLHEYVRVYDSFDVSIEQKEEERKNGEKGRQLCEEDYEKER